MSFEQSSEQEQELSPVLQEIVGMDLNYDDEEEFEKAAHTDSVSKETSEDAFLRIARKLIEGEDPSPNTWGAMLRILDRDSMKEHPKMKLFRQAVEELAEKFDHELKLKPSDKSESE